MANKLALNNLGSTRAVLTEDGTLLQDANYYPGGLSFSQLNDSEETDRLHSGKEWVDLEGLAWYDNAARFHDSILCRFTTPDPLAEKTPWLSPYAYCMGNPIRYIDPSGMVPIYNQDGYLLGTDDNGLQGNAIIMDSQHFKQGMPYDEAMKHSLGIEGY